MAIVGDRERCESMLEVDIKERVFNTHGGQSLHAIGELKFSLKPDSFTVIVGPSGVRQDHDTAHDSRSRYRLQRPY